MRILVVMDPPSTILVDEDTTYGLMLAAQDRGHALHFALISDLYLKDGKVWARVCDAECTRKDEKPLALGDAYDCALADVDVVLMRKDPPFDAAYLYATLLLEHARGSTWVVNDPRGLRDANEKIYATYFPDLMPSTLISNDKQRIRAFVSAIGGRAVLKPLDGRGGEGIFALDTGDPNFNSIVETVTGFGQRLAMAQTYLPEVAEGDKRILLLNGEALGAILRVPSGGDLRSNIHVGGRVKAAQLDENDHLIVKRLAPRLREDGLFFVGLDVIGGRLTEVNVTSPTGIRQASDLDGADYEGRVIDFLEAGAPSGR